MPQKTDHPAERAHSSQKPSTTTNKPHAAFVLLVEWFLMNAKRKFTVVKRQFKVKNVDGDVQSRCSQAIGDVATVTQLPSAKNAKTGAPLLIFLTKQQGILCPVAALRRRLSGTDSSRTFLFGYLKGGKWFHLAKKKNWFRGGNSEKV
ncbi:hypothetical protein PtA15_8A299 [Puccinia triticina]|uniref:DDE-1 domain-containing protein n=1 Tax=Puccinia triticina TaxID=208348 RepID=A0ABY7CUE0_9BASI|nr:uncharacterized protein PtA15_8A299 [Puccinia triticina]WAQ87395.1 hypothetical protein PtA15_8A299 [Puccinia triticina]